MVAGKGFCESPDFAAILDRFPAESEVVQFSAARIAGEEFPASGWH